MSTGLTIGAVIIGVTVMLLFWAQPLKIKARMFGLAVLLGIVMTVVRLSFGYSDGILNALINPPSWKLLGIFAATIGLGISILWTLLLPGDSPKKK